jgi:single-strand DNA-binding protein
MANLNKVMLIGRLTRDPEVRTFSNGGKVAKFGFAVNIRKKNQQTGEWENEPVFIDMEAFNRGDFGKLADRIEQYLRKGQQVYIEGHLRLDQWTSQDGQKRSKLMVVVDNFEFLEPRSDSSAGEGGGRPARASAPPTRSAASSSDDIGEGRSEAPEPQEGSGGDDIPF